MLSVEKNPETFHIPQRIQLRIGCEGIQLRKLELADCWVKTGEWCLGVCRTLLTTESGESHCRSLTPRGAESAAKKGDIRQQKDRAGVSQDLGSLYSSLRVEVWNSRCQHHIAVKKPTVSKERQKRKRYKVYLSFCYSDNEEVEYI